MALGVIALAAYTSLRSAFVFSYPGVGELVRGMYFSDAATAFTTGKDLTYVEVLGRMGGAAQISQVWPPMSVALSLAMLVGAFLVALALLITPIFVAVEVLRLSKR
jgi:hypothetical protein